MGLHTARRLAQELAYRSSCQNPELFGCYYDHYCNTDAFPGAHRIDPRCWRFVTRLIPMREVLRRYLPELRRAELGENGERDMRHQIFSKSFAPDSEMGYCWAVELLLPVYCKRVPDERTPDEAPTNRALLVFLWRISDNGGGPRTTLVLQTDGSYEPQDL